MPAATYNYMWVVYPEMQDRALLFSKMDKVEDYLSESGSFQLRKLERGTNVWEIITGRGQKFTVIKQKVMDSDGL